MQIVLAAVLWSTSGFFVKAPWFDAWPEDVRGLMLAFWRSAFSAGILLPMIRRPVWRWQMLPMVVCFAVMVWSYMTAMVHGTAANAIWLQYLSPAWVLIGGVWILKEKVSSADIRMFLFCLAGVTTILGFEMTRNGNIFAAMMGVLSGMTFAGVVLCIRSMREVDPAWLIALNHTATALMLLPWVTQVETSIEPFGYFALALFGIFQMSVPYILFARGLRTTSSPEASILTLIEPVLVPIWVFVAWHSHPSYDSPRWWTWVGAALILAGLLSRYLPVLIRSQMRNQRELMITPSDENR